MNLAYIGLGNMGTPIARNLLRAGHGVTVYNRTPAKAEALEADGAQIAESPASAVVGCDAVLTMVSDDAALEEIAWGRGGFASVLGAGIPHISQSTITLGCARSLAERHHDKGQIFLSAPVFGRPEAAEGKRLVIVTAGDQSIVNRFQPVFDSLGRHTFHAGPEPWQANAVKLCGNLMLFTVVEAFGESFAAMRKSNVDPHLFFEVMNELFASPIMAAYGSRIVNEQFTPPGFTLRNGLKDMRYILELAQDRNAPLPLASLIRDHILSALAHGDAELDATAFARVASRLANA